MKRASLATQSVHRRFCTGAEEGRGGEEEAGEGEGEEEEEEEEGKDEEAVGEEG